MNIHTIDTGYFKLDGGAMFGIVPKSIWNRIIPADDKNLCTWAMRCLLVEKGDRLILIDTGLGNKQSEKFFSYFEPHGDDSLMSSLNKKGFGADDITDVLLTHLHFDHCGGAVEFDADGQTVPAFKNATYWSNEKHWESAVNPNAREKASFLKENFMPIQESGQLKFLNEGDRIIDELWVTEVNGHTEAMLIPHIQYKGQNLIYMADLLPSPGHIPLPYVMGYDIRPLITLSEKEAYLNKTLDEDCILIFEHDPKIECCNLQQTERGIRMKESFPLSEIL